MEEPMEPPPGGGRDDAKELEEEEALGARWFDGGTA